MRVRRNPLLVSLCLLIPALYFSSCAHNARVSSNGSSVPGMNVRGEGGARSVAETGGAPLTEGPATPNDLSDSGEDMKKIPHEVNRLVLQWIDYFQGRGRPHMERYLSRSTRYIPMMKEILHKKGLPEDLVYIALIESGFNSSAHSSASAVGYWQFIRGTGRHYGLRVDSYVDERRDFEKSTYAAADYFSALYNLFGSWYLAIASYNVGENRIKNSVMRYHTRDFWEMTTGRKLPAETVNYVPKFLAARMIAKEPEKYGFKDVAYMPPLKWSEVEVAHSVDLRKMAEELKVEPDAILDLNPSFKRGVALDKDGKVTIRIPDETKDRALAAADVAIVVPGAEMQKTLARLASGEDEFSLYKVRRGDTLASIARKFRTSTRVLRRLNGMRGGARIIAGKKIKVPGESLAGLSKRESSAASPRRELARAEKASLAKVEMPRSKKSRSPARAQTQVHIVRRGDTLIDIARQYRVSLTQLASTNRISRRSQLNIGARLEIPR